MTEISQLESPSAATLAERSAEQLWRWQLIVIGVLTAALYWPVLARLVVQWWNDPNFSHGFFIPLFSAFLLWRKRSHLSAVPVKPSWMGLALVGVALFLLIVGVLGAELFLSRSSFVFLIAGLIVLFEGWPRFRAALFPWLFLFLMIPIPTILFTQITFPLQLLASKLATHILAWSGVPVLREGNVITVPAMSLEVAEACSGIRSLLSLGTMAIVYGYFTEASLRLRVLLAIAAIPIAVFANAVRIVGTGLLVQYWNPEKAEGFFHSFSGWIIFVISLLMLIALHRFVRHFWRSS